MKPVGEKVRLAEAEVEVLKTWEEKNIFEKTLAKSDRTSPFVFYDGPPFATGLPHYGHLLAGTIKDIVPRYHAMRGYYVQRRFGWDCHGLPIEALAQENLGLPGAGAILETGVGKFNETCRSMVLQYAEEWRKIVTRMGRWVDFENYYKTMDCDFMESVWWVFKQLWDQGRVYRAYRIMPYSWKLNTPLSNFEAGNNYKEIQDPAITVRFRLNDSLAGDAPSYAIAWTTTPWTLPGNLALCVGADIDYAVIQDVSTGDLYVMAETRLSTYYPEEEMYERKTSVKGRDLAGRTYIPLFDTYIGHPDSFRILQADFVTTEEGTGVVHAAPAYGEDDYQVCAAEGINLVDYLDDDCRFTEVFPEFQGMFCKEADKGIIKRLKDEGKLVHQSTYVHNYPYCERTETPLIYRAIDAWYVRVSDLRDRMVELNSTIRWVPEYVGSKRFDNWLRAAKDWNISRNRFWGSCIPLWISENDPQDIICVGSIAELEDLSGHTVDDLHKHVVDTIVIKRDGNTYRRTPEVLDCWFESGSMPYGQNHYPFENREAFDASFPADFIAEGLDQTRGWFYTLTVLSTALFDRPAFRNVIVNGLVLAADGRKMSKRLQNYPDPMAVIDAYGADALRLCLIASPVVQAEDLSFSEEGVKHALRHLLLPWWNAYAFFVQYARVDNWQPDPDAGADSDHLLDRWILSSLETLNAEVISAMDEYELRRAVPPCVQFIEDLTNWYIRRSRRRFWKSEDDEDKRQAYDTLYKVLLRLSTITAPFVPFVSDMIYRNLRNEDQPISVHLCEFPEGDPQRRDKALEAKMRDVMTVVGLGRTLRVEQHCKIRQPLARVHIACRDADRRNGIADLQGVVSDELNVHAVQLHKTESDFATLSAKVNFRRLGSRLGKEMKSVAQAVQGLSSEDCEVFLKEGELKLVAGGKEYELGVDDVILERTPREGLHVAAEGALVLALEVQLTPPLIREGLSREFVNKVQQMRKSADLEVTQRIRIDYQADEEVYEAIEEHRLFIDTETLSLGTNRKLSKSAEMIEWDLNGHPASIGITSVN